MLIEESVWIKNKIATHLSEGNFPLLNIGSSTGHFRKVVQKHIHENIFAPLESAHKKVIHLDMKMAEGVDMIGDLSEDTFRETLKNKGIKSVLCSNLLEHLADPKPICTSILDLLQPKGIIIVTVPHAFPFHKDPIDTYFRPGIAELHTLFPGTRIVEAQIVQSDSSYAGDLFANKKYLGIMLGRLAMPFFRPGEWGFIARDFFQMRRKYSATCLLLEKA